MDYSPKEAAQKLGIAPVTLRKWAGLFTNSLSTPAQKAITSDGGTAQRRYSESDLATLRRVKALLGSGLTYSQVKREINGTEEAENQRAIQQTHTPISDITRAAGEIINTQRIAIAALQDQIAMLKAEVTRLETANRDQRARYIAIIRKLIARL